MNNKIIAVTGATGQQGGAVARKLLADGWKVRALTRDVNKPAAQALAEAGAELFAGDMDSRSDLEAAFQGVYGVFSVQNFWLPNVGFEGEIQQGKMLPMPPRLQAYSIWFIRRWAQHIAAWDKNISRANGSSSNISTHWIFPIRSCARCFSWTITTGAGLISAISALTAARSKASTSPRPRRIESLCAAKNSPCARGV